jgi:hypothetical protein
VSLPSHRVCRTGRPGLDAAIERLAAEADRDQPYRPPTADERAAAAAAVDGLRACTLTPEVVAAFDRLGMDASAGTDTASGRAYRTAVSRPGARRSWGAVVVDRGAAASVLVEVPHPRTDLRTEEMGLVLFRAVPGAVLLVAGAHRRAGGGRADVAHESGSLFHAVATHLGRSGLPELQLHGFHDDSLPGFDAVISPGAGRAGDLAVRIAGGLAAAGLRVCTAWTRDCGCLEGRTNEQGRAAAAAGRPFVHIELSGSVREDDAGRTEVLRVLAAAVAPSG